MTASYEERLKGFDWATVARELEYNEDGTICTIDGGGKMEPLKIHENADSNQMDVVTA